MALLATAILGAWLRSEAAEVGPRFTETALQGAFTFNFSNYLTWPARCWTSPEAALVIGVIGQEDVARILEDLIRRKPAADHPRVVRRLTRIGEARECHIVFVGKPQDGAAVIAAAAGEAVLLVGEADGFLELGGHIQFVRSGENVVFDVNQLGAEAAGLKISSKVLSLARRVIRQTTGNPVAAKGAP